eukprot:scaffold10467_cov88-Isochrysis_galbana.AAC.2
MPGSSEWPNGRAGVGWDGCRLGQGSAWREVGDGGRRGELYGVRVCWLVVLWPGAAAATRKMATWCEYGWQMMCVCAVSCGCSARMCDRSQ